MNHRLWTSYAVGLVLSQVGCAGPDDEVGAVLGATLEKINSESQEHDISAYVDSLAAGSLYYRMQVPCGSGSGTFSVDAVSPRSQDGLISSVDISKQDWFASVLCDDDEIYGHFRGDVLFGVWEEGGSSQFTMSGWLNTKTLERCDFELSGTYDPSTGETIEVAGDLCGEAATGLQLTIPRFGTQ